MDANRWNECVAYVERDGKAVVKCDLPLHCDPADGTALHWDSTLDIKWSYADGAPDYEMEPEK